MSLADSQVGSSSSLRLRLGGRTFEEILSDLPVARDLPTRKLEALEVVFSEGDRGDQAFLIVEGSIYIEKRGPHGSVRRIAHLAEGDLFGEMAVLDDPVRSATARAGAKGARIRSIPAATLGRIFAEAPEVARYLLKVLSHRLRVMTKMSTEMEALQDVNRRIIEAQDQERRRIARDIHDGPAQAYADYVMRVAILEKLMERDPGQAKSEAVELKRRIEEGLDRLRAIIHNLHVKDFRRSGLEVAIRKFVDRQASEWSFEVAIRIADELTGKLPDSLSNTAYCLVQEALNNARKHSKAKKVEIVLEPSERDQCRLLIKDDGVGFDVAALLASYHQRESLGLTSMQERAQLAGGTMEIESKPGKGTTLRFLFPTNRGGTG